MTSTNTSNTTTSTSYKQNDVEKKQYKWDIVWINVVLLGILHIIAIYSWFNRFNYDFRTILWKKIFGIISAIGVTAGLHRYFCHKAYEANTFVKILLATMASMTYQNSIYVWCRDHRVHHKYSETDADPHNSKRGFFFSHVGWLLIRKHKDVIEKGKTVDLSDLEADKIVMFQHKYYYPLVFLGTLVFPTLVPQYFWNESLKNSLLTAVESYVMSVNFTWCINSFAHYVGTKPYDESIGAVENSFAKICAVGEGFHNFHHVFPWDYRASEYGFEGRNITAGFIDLLAKFGWVWNRKTVSEDVLKKRAARTGDGTYKGSKVDQLSSFLLFMTFFIIV